MPIDWPDDHPNTKNLRFVAGSRQIIEGVPHDALAIDTIAVLDRIEAVIGEMDVGKTRAELHALVAQVGPLMTDAIARMDRLRPLYSRDLVAERGRARLLAERG